MGSDELAWLAATAAQSQSIAEIGCWQGRSTKALADSCRGRVFAIDHFLGAAEHQEWLADKPAAWQSSP
jgi:predicted O-methyltransferase YrrM